MNINKLLNEIKDTENLKEILSYIERDKVKCIYLYIDLLVYGLKNPYLRVWYDTDDQGIRMVIMKYHKSFQVYSNRSFNETDNLLKLIDKETPYCISGRQEIIKAIENKLPQYNAEYGMVIQHPDPDEKKLRSIMALENTEIIQATVEDAKEIASLICSDDELGAPYTVDSLTEELSERMKTGMGRSFVIRDKGKIVAHTATFAESDEYAVGGGLVVDKEYRHTDYFYNLDNYVKLLLKKEGKSLLGMILDKRLQKVYERKGGKTVAHYGKLSLIEKN